MALRFAELRRVLLWGSALLVSGVLTVRNAVGPPPHEVPPAPAAEVRLPTPAELQVVHQRWASLQNELDHAREQRSGRPLPVDALEATDPEGVPWLPSGIPDNPLAPGVGWVLARCGGTAEPGPRPDWFYCQSTGVVHPWAPSGTLEQ